MKRKHNKTKTIKKMNNQPETKRGFKRKTIEQTIKAKLGRWLDSIKDEELRGSVRDHYILTGGAIASMLLGDMPNDYDVYIDNVDVANDLANYYIKKLRNDDDSKAIVIKHEGRVEVKVHSSGVLNKDDSPENNKENTGKYNVLAITSNAITLSDNVQVVLRFVGPAEEIHKNYDFVHATNYYTEKTGLVLHQAALESILARELKYVGSLYPVCSIFRIKKFINRGWTITAGETLKILFDVNKLDLYNIEVLKDQLTGVDTTYFQRLIEELQAGDAAGKAIDRTYIFEIINEIFDGTEREDKMTEENEHE
jgi:hypothetical protein